MTFPYISQIHVNDCYAYQNFDIPKIPSSEMKHIILTGKNGSGKTTILNRMAHQINYYSTEKNRNPIQFIGQLIAQNKNHQSMPTWQDTLQNFTTVEIKYLNNIDVFLEERGKYIFSFFKAHRRVELDDVNTVTKEEDFYKQLNKKKSPENLIKQFKQYLVNKKVYEAFDYMSKGSESLSESRKFFDNLTQTLRVIFKDPQLELEFKQEQFEFYLHFSDSRKVTFNQLSEGFSAFLSIIVELLMRGDLLRKQENDYSLDPEGIVLIDEPETHFHLSMQYEILPLITSLFPKIQLIVATHSPAIISSLKDAVIYDLTSQTEVSDWLLGSSYSELMIKHFGLENEFSPFADKIILDINSALTANNVEKLNEILLTNDKYLTPSLRLEIESQIIHLNSKKIQ